MKNNQIKIILPSIALVCVFGCSASIGFTSTGLTTQTASASTSAFFNVTDPIEKFAFHFRTIAKTLWVDIAESSIPFLVQQPPSNR
jgi:hypothetical protein